MAASLCLWSSLGGEEKRGESWFVSGCPSPTYGVHRTGSIDHGQERVYTVYLHWYGAYIQGTNTSLPDGVARTARPEKMMSSSPASTMTADAFFHPI
jgi:hypothetical protein